MAKTSKMTANRLTVSRTVHSSVATHGSELAEVLTQVLFPDGPPAKWTMEKVLAAVGAVLVRADKAVGATELAHAAELSDDDEVRRARDEAVATLRGRLISLRELLSGLFGAAILSSYALDAAVPETAQQLLGFAAAAAELLHTRALVEEPRHPSVVIQPQLMADELMAEHKTLQAALDATKREEREAQLTMEDKNRAAESWQAAYQAVSSTFYGLCLLAGRKDLADRITPTARRRAGLPDEGDGGALEPPVAPPTTT